MRNTGVQAEPVDVSDAGQVTVTVEVAGEMVAVVVGWVRE